MKSIRTCNITIVLVSCAVFMNAALACSDVMITGNGFTAVARSLDFPGGGQPPGGGGIQMGYVPVGAENTADLNLPQSWPPTPVTWRTAYAAIGQVRYTNAIHDGINSAGLYVARQNLPSAWTRYPSPVATDPRPELGAMDVPSYILGTAASVEEALTNLSQVQVVINAPLSNILGRTVPLAYPYHLIVRDRFGSTLVVEWIDGKTHTYYHRTGTPDTQERVDFGEPMIHQGFTIAAVTNEPPLTWHIDNGKQYSSLFMGNSKAPVDDTVILSTGYLGLPGDYSSPSRFTRLNVLARFAPAPLTAAQAESIAQSTLTTVITPVSGGSEFTLWSSLSNLTDRIYYWHPVMNAVNTDTDALSASPWDPTTPSAVRFELDLIMQSGTLPKGFVDGRIQVTPVLSQAQVQIANQAAKAGIEPTIGPVSVNYSGAITVFDRDAFDLSPGSGITYLP